MGKIFYDMGFLSTAQVEECSATDLIGQYIGQTGPKTQQKLEKALGRVLFIDEAYRLAEGHFATEAMDEITDCLTKPKFFRKLIVILAGYDEDLNRLMSINPGLTSRFPETVVFNAFAPEDCLQLMTKLLQKRKHLDCAILSPPSAELRNAILDTFDRLIKSPSWANARDVEQVVKNMEGTILKSAKNQKPKLILSQDVIVSALNTMLSERTHRGQSVGSSRVRPESLPLPIDKPEPETRSNIQTTISTSQKTDEKSAAPITSSENPTDDVTRDPGVSDEIWQDLQRDKTAAKALEKAHEDLCEQEKSLAQNLADAEGAENDRQQSSSSNKETAQPDNDEDDDDDEEEKRRREAERLRRVKEMRAMQEKMERLRRERERQQEQRRKEEMAQTKLRQMGLCVAGFRWIKQHGGYRCAGGSHWVSDRELGI